MSDRDTDDQSSGSSQPIDDLVLQFDEEWQSAERPPDLGYYLQQSPASRRQDLLAELIVVDLEYRWRRGDRRLFSDYVASYPELLTIRQESHHRLIVEQFRVALMTGNQPIIRDHLVTETDRDSRTELFWRLCEVSLALDSTAAIDALVADCREQIDGSRPTPAVILRAQFDQLWNETNHPLIERLLAQAAPSERVALRVHLVERDMVRRWEVGKPRWLEHYVNHYPEIIGAGGELPDPLIMRERTLSSAWRITGGETRCPFCQQRRETDDTKPECRHCRRTIRGAADDDVASRQIAGYQLVRLLGLGGYGKVYKAWDCRGRTIVAVKIPHASLMSLQGFSRFQREVRLVTHLQHPNIVRIVASQLTDRPDDSYIVYEYINGPVLSGAAYGRNRDYPEIARVMAAIADAVQYAHDKRIIHRDLKPRNILIGADGAPRISDLGLGKLSAMTRTADFSANDQVIGTPEYMSPEQFAGDGSDYRSDIYSLGVVLYELLTETVPFQAPDLFELRARVNSMEAPSPRALVPTTPIDLERICLRCLRKRPAQRYASARSMANDLRRFVAGRPVLARAPTWRTRLLLWTRWHPGAAVMRASLALAALVILTLVIVHSLSQQKHKIREAASTANVAKAWTMYYRVLGQQAEWAGVTTPYQKEDVRYQQTLGYLQDIYGGDERRSVELVREFIAGDFRPVAHYLRSQGDNWLVRYHLGNVYFLIEEFASAQRFYEVALEGYTESGVKKSAILRNIGECHLRLNQFEQARERFDSARLVDEETYGAGSPEVVVNWLLLGDTFYYWGKFDAMVRYFEAALDIDRQNFPLHHPNIARDLDRLGGAWYTLGDYDRAIDHFQRALTINIDALGPDHEAVGKNWSHLGGPHYAKGQYEEAVTCFRNALTVYVKRYGRIHPQTSRSYDLLGGALFDLGKLDEALACFERAVAIDSQLHTGNPYHTSFSRDYGHLGGVYLAKKEYAVALEHFRRAYEIDRRTVPARHPEIARHYERFGKAWLALGKANRARGYFEAALEIDRETYTAAHPTIAADYRSLGLAWRALNQPKNARRCWNEALRINRRTHGDDHTATNDVRQLLAGLDDGGSD